MSVLAIDWDGTLVDSDQNWFPYAEEALRALTRMGHTVIVHSCRANWPEGLAQIEHKLSAAHLPIAVWSDAGKPAADLYIDDRGVHFLGDWPRFLDAIKSATPAEARPLPQLKTKARRPRRSGTFQ